jgi:hypothetical protein
MTPLWAVAAVVVAIAAAVDASVVVPVEVPVRVLVRVVLVGALVWVRVRVRVRVPMRLLSLLPELPVPPPTFSKPVSCETTAVVTSLHPRTEQRKRDCFSSFDQAFDPDEFQPTDRFQRGLKNAGLNTQT